MTVDDRTINSRQDKCAFIRILATTITIFYTPFIFPSLLLDGFVTCHRAVRRHTRSPVTRRSTRATQAQAAPDIHVGQPGTKDRTQRETHGPSQARGVHWGRTAETAPEPERDRHDSPRSDMPRHGLVVWGVWVAISAPKVHSPTKKRPGEVYRPKPDPNSRNAAWEVLLGRDPKRRPWVCLNHRDEAHPLS